MPCSSHARASATHCGQVTPSWPSIIRHRSMRGHARALAHVRSSRYLARFVGPEGGVSSVSDLVLAGGTVVTAEGSFRADVAVSGETIEAVGLDLPRDGAEVVDVSGARVMPGFIDGHTHMD